MSFLDKKISGALAAQLSGVQHTTLRAWMLRGHLSDDRAGDFLTVRDALRLAIAAPLISIGVHPRDAWVAATKFVAMGKMSVGTWVVDEPGLVDREAGGLFRDGLTVLLIYADGESKIINAPSADAVPLLRRNELLSPAGPVVVLVLNEIVNNFMTAARREICGE